MPASRQLRRRRRTIFGTIALLAGCGAMTLATALPAAAANTVATVSVLNALSTARGPVDVYAGTRLVADAVPLGALATAQIPAGTYDLVVVADGSPRQSPPLAEAADVRIAGGSNVTLVPHATRSGGTRLTVFTNDTRTVGMGKGRLTVRHVAVAPRLDVRLDGSVRFPGVRAGGQPTAGLDAGTYRMEVALSGTRPAVVGPDLVTIRNRPGRDDMGTHTIVYLWGSAADGALQRTVQNVRIDLQ